MKKGAVIALLLGILVAGLAFTKDAPVVTKAELGKQLFFDPILSEDQTVSCASCHNPKFAFADTAAFSKGVHGQLTTRNTPSAMNVASREALFWDGRSPTLAAQALMPIANPQEMNLPIDSAIKRLLQHPVYTRLFRKIFGTPPNAIHLGEALAAYEATLETGDTPNDRWLADKTPGLSKQQIRGREVFRGKGLCLECHFTPDFTGDEFRSIGLFNGRELNDSGRYVITKNPADIGKFKVPGLRNVAVTGPYMHDGSFRTLRQVIDYYDDPVKVMPGGLNRDSLLERPLSLTEQEKQDLEAFLRSLTDDRFVQRK